MADRKDFDPEKPHAFLSYTRADDEYLDGGITWLRGALERAVRARTGSPFQIFQDVEDIEHGENWEKKLNEVLESAQLFIPILTPSFFTSDFCRREAVSFLDYEGMAKRDDLVLPIYMIDAEILDDPQKRADDELAARLLERQHDDWRELRFELRDPGTRPRFEQLADILARAAKRRVKAGSTKPRPSPRAPKLKADATDRLATLEAKLADRDRAVEAERSKIEQLTFALADKDTKLRELAEAPSAFEGQVEEARKRENALQGEIRQLKEQLAERDGKSVKQQLAEMEAALDEERENLEKIKRYPLGMPPAMLLGGAALMLLVGIGSWMSGRQAATPIAPNAGLEAASANTPSAVSTAESFKDCADCPEMVVIPAGTFLMGSPEGEGTYYQRPQHVVTIAAPFALGKYEVTFAEWDVCVAAGSCDHEPDDRGWGRGDRPVIDVSWNDAQQYCGWLSERTGNPYRLPSEAEWEYAARAGTKTAYPWGDEIGENRANCEGCGSQWDGKQTAPVGSFEPNSFGLFDMHGNVYEWVEDRLHGNYQDAPDDGTPWLEGDGTGRVVRGGSWYGSAGRVRSAYRGAREPGFRNDLLGFRCAGVQEPVGG